MGRTRRISRVGRAAVALVLAGGLLAGCAGTPGAAAVVDGERISMSAVRAATEDLSPVLPGITPSHALYWLIIAPTFEEVGREHGLGISRDEAIAALAGLEGSTEGQEFGDEAVAVARTMLANSALGAHPDRAEIGAVIDERLMALDVEVNPRFGELDFAVGIQPVDHPWIVTPE